MSLSRPPAGSSPLARGTLIPCGLHRLHLRFIPARAGNTERRDRSYRRFAVHPRSRGEHRTSSGCSTPSRGSSPLARGTPTGWGTLLSGRPQPPAGRFIPARAGNTPPPRAAVAVRSVHPRSRGEHQCGLRSSPSESGSSPLARGTPARGWPGAFVTRFIPARAGNTCNLPPAVLLMAVHPRSRGEHDLAVRRRRVNAGSSPLARGTRDADPARLDADRFIPARAGNTIIVTLRSTVAPVHPRSRGEHPVLPIWAASASGSSPLARGTLTGSPTRKLVLRFIPARAGNTTSTFASSRTLSVHPRSRGEHIFPSEVTSAEYGSSPLARGTPDCKLYQVVVARFIPARAGNTASFGAADGVLPVHPRSRGEHSVSVNRNRSRYGSSPLARGTLLNPPRVPASDRFIPARAGNTCPARFPSDSRPVHPRSRGEHRVVAAGQAVA